MGDYVIPWEGERWVRVEDSPFRKDIMAQWDEQVEDH